MPRFFLSVSQITDGRVAIGGGDARHIARVLRMKVGEEITVVDMQKNKYTCTLSSVSDGEVLAEVTAVEKCNTEPPFFATLYQAFPKGDKMDYIIQKAVELGVGEIVPIMTERCVSRPDGAALEKKLARWQKISESAAAQSGRGAIPPLRRPMSFSEAAVEASSKECPLFCYEGDGTRPLGGLIDAQSREVGIIIGPEGGFSTAEVETAVGTGLTPVGLGRRILRTETASGFVLSCLTFATELKGNTNEN